MGHTFKDLYFSQIVDWARSWNIDARLTLAAQFLVGAGSVCQRRLKSFPIEDDDFHRVNRYVDWNVL